MAETYKILGQIAPADSKEHVLYTSPAGTQTIVTNITAVNRTNTAQTFDINVYPSVPDLSDSSGPLAVTVAKYSSLSATTTNGTTWNQGTLPSSTSWSKVVHGNNKFVAFANYQSSTAISTNGLTWTQGTLTGGLTLDIKSALFGNNVFLVLTSPVGTNIRSTDGITWTTITVPEGSEGANYEAATYGAEKFFAFPQYNSSVISSTDGITWSSGSLPIARSWKSAVYGDDKFVLLQNNYETPGGLYSTDGITWTEMTVPAGNWLSVAYGNGKFVALAQGQYSVSTNGIVWSQNDYVPGDANYRKISYASGFFVATSYYGQGKAATSTDAITWTISTIPGGNRGWDAVVGATVSVPYSSPAVNNVYKNASIDENQFEVLEPGIVLGAQNSIVVKGTANTTFSVYGTELS
jgi:hypothetical protein